MKDTRAAENPHPPTYSAKSLEFVQYNMMDLLRQVSQRLDKNFLLQSIVIFAGMVYLGNKNPESFPIYGFQLPGTVLSYAIPLVLIKLILDWGYESYQYLLVRTYLSRILTKRLSGISEKYLPDRRQDVLLPACMYKFIFAIEQPQEKRKWVNVLVFLVQLILTSLIIFIASLNYLVVLYYFRVNLGIKAWAFVYMLYPLYYCFHYFSLGKHLKGVYWYPVSIVILVLWSLFIGFAGLPILCQLDIMMKDKERCTVSGMLPGSIGKIGESAIESVMPSLKRSETAAP